MPSSAELRRVDVEQALEVLAADGLVAFPTETVWGLAARAESQTGVERLRAFKGRDAGKPVAVLVDSASRLESLGVDLGPAARRLAAVFWPGPLTLVCHCRHPFARGVAGAGGSAVGFRCSSHPVAAALAASALDRRLGPVTATSLNRSGEAPARNEGEALRVAAGAPGLAVCYGEAGGELPSTVVDASKEPLEVLREGAIPARAIHDSIAQAEIASR